MDGLETATQFKASATAGACEGGFGCLVKGILCWFFNAFVLPSAVPASSCAITDEATLPTEICACEDSFDTAGTDSTSVDTDKRQKNIGGDTCLCKLMKMVVLLIHSSSISCSLLNFRC